MLSDEFGHALASILGVGYGLGRRCIGFAKEATSSSWYLLAALYGLTTPTIFGLTYNTLFIALLSLGLAALSVLFGAYILKAATGTVLPLDIDTNRWRSVMFRGGQGP